MIDDSEDNQTEVFTYELTLFQPESFKKSPQRGTRIYETWDELSLYISRPMVEEEKDKHGGLSLASFLDNVRQKKFIERIRLIGLDIDHGEISPKEGHEFFDGFQHIIYTTFRHEPGAPRWRAILPFDRDVTVGEYDALWPVLQAQLKAVGIHLDAGAKDASRLWYVPCVHPERDFEMFAGEGAPVCADSLLDIARELREREAARPRVAPKMPAVMSDRYLQGALRKAAMQVATASDGDRNNTLNRACYSLARLPIPDHVIINVLTEAARAAGLDAKETYATVRSGLKARR